MAQLDWCKGGNVGAAGPDCLEGERGCCLLRIRVNLQKILPRATSHATCNMQLATCNPAMQYHACYVTKPPSVRVWTLVGEKILPWHVALIFTASYFQYLRIDCLGRMSHVEMLIFRITSPRVILSVLKGHILYFLFIEED